MTDNYGCPICGYCGFALSPSTHLTLNYCVIDNVCSACGFNFNDIHSRKEWDNAVHQWRIQWIRDGMKWQSEKPCPPDWNPEVELTNVSLRFKGYLDDGSPILERITYTCPVCGYDKMEEPARSEHGSASLEFCISCGFQFGYDDDSEGISYTQWRTKWIEGGMEWWSSSRSTPENWNPIKQLKNIGITLEN